MVIRDGGVMDKKIRGIIINEYPFEDTSKIINIFTSDGIVGVLAKGAKRIKSPFFGSTTRFSYGEFDINYKDNGLSILKDASIINNYSKIKKDIVKIGYVTYITELSSKVYKHDSNKRIYDLYKSSMDKIDEGFNPRIITIILKLQLLDYLGIRPIIDRCVSCSSKNDIVTISSYLGGYVCKNCLDNLRNEKIVLTKTVKLIRMFYLVDIAKISKLDISDNVIRELEEFTEDYYDRYSGIYLKSKILLDSVK